MLLKCLIGKEIKLKVQRLEKQIKVISLINHTKNQNPLLRLSILKMNKINSISSNNTQNLNQLISQYSNSLNGLFKLCC